MTFLLDTNVVSELRRLDRANPNVVDWATSVDAEHLYLSAVTIMEVELGAVQIARREPARGAELRAWIDGYLLRHFAERILAFDAAAALRCAVLHVPDRRPERDAMIAATAFVHSLTVVTRNTRDFRSAGVKVLNPWLGVLERGE